MNALALLAAIVLTAPPDAITLQDALVLPKVGQFGRVPFPRDPILARFAGGTWTAPREGDDVTDVDGAAQTWRTAAAGDDGWLKGPALRGGYAHWSVESPDERIMILQPSGHSAVHADGAWRAGDPYGNGWVQLPVRLSAGRNDFLFHVSRGRVRARLTAPPADAFFSTREVTLPDLIHGEPWAVQGAVVIVNATAERLDDLVIRAGGSGLPVHETHTGAIEPMTFRKTPFWFGGPLPPDALSVEVDLALTRTVDGALRVLDETTVTARVRSSGQRHKRTFVSDIDGSVQYYAVTPQSGAGRVRGGMRSLYLTLHGASVEATGQAAVYEPKPDGDVVAPTNRRPFGFDWEDWGRLDALEVLALAQRGKAVDPDRIFLTGHSMGGHGTWHLGVTYPGTWAAIGPSAGWRSFRAYTGAAAFEADDPIEQMLRRSTSASDTVALSGNLRDVGVYILHGEVDDNVPVDQARFMFDHLQGFHDDVVYHEEPGAGHWWGNRCCDWPPMFTFFAERRRPDPIDVDRVEFHTANPGVSASVQWITIEQQIESCVISSVIAERGPEACRVEITTENVARLALDPDGFEPAPITVVVDDQLVGPAAWPEDGRPVAVRRTDGVWTVDPEPLPADQKGPHRAGPFKDAIRHHVQFVYGTMGTPDENAWARAKARFDAETFWYRGNASIDVVPDHTFDPERERDQSVVLYGNADTNAAWASLLGASPVQMSRGAVLIEDRREVGGNLGCLLTRPRPGSDRASVAAVGGTGIQGMRLTDRLPVFVSGVGYPDVVVFGPETLEAGPGGVRVAGFFGPDWNVASGQFVFE